MARIFISYKRVDKDNVFKIKDQIESALGEKCWIDLDGIESDAQFKNVIINAINECEIVLFMYSRAHSKIEDFEADWTVRELSFAAAKKRRIVFVNIDGSPLTDEFAFDYGNKQQVDARSSVALEKLINDLGKWLDKDVSVFDITYLPEEIKLSQLLSLTAISLGGSVAMGFNILRIHTSLDWDLGILLLLGGFFGSSLGVIFIRRLVKLKLPNLTFFSLLLLFTFFSTNTFMSVVLCFRGVDYIKSNLPLIPFLLISSVALVMLMNLNKWGFYLFGVSIFALSISSYWWLMSSIYMPICMFVMSIVTMCAFIAILKKERNGISLRNLMMNV